MKGRPIVKSRAKSKKFGAGQAECRKPAAASGNRLLPVPTTDSS
jgi:hypothetical protein